MNIEVGEYIRDKEGNIGKITKMVTDDIFYAQFYNNLEWKTDYEEAENIIDTMYQNKMKERETQTENTLHIDMSKDIEFTKLEMASVRVLREELKLKRELDIVLKELEKAKKQLDLDYVDNNYISKDELKKVLRRVQDYQLNYKDTVLFNIIMQEIFGETEWINLENKE